MGTSRKKIKPTEEGMEDDDDDDPGITKLMGDCDDLIKGLESDIRSVKTKKSRKKEKKVKPTAKGFDLYTYVYVYTYIYTYAYESAIRFHTAKKLRKEKKPTDEGSDKKMHKKCSIPRKRQK